MSRATIDLLAVKICRFRRLTLMLFSSEPIQFFSRADIDTFADLLSFMFFLSLMLSVFSFVRDGSSFIRLLAQTSLQMCSFLRTSPLPPLSPKLAPPAPAGLILNDGTFLIQTISMAAGRFFACNGGEKLRFFQCKPTFNISVCPRSLYVGSLYVVSKLSSNQLVKTVDYCCWREHTCSVLRTDIPVLVYRTDPPVGV